MALFIIRIAIGVKLLKFTAIEHPVIFLTGIGIECPDPEKRT
jgi:hypothetical protein